MNFEGDCWAINGPVGDQVGVKCSLDSLINITISMLLFSVNFYPEASVLIQDPGILVVGVIR